MQLRVGVHEPGACLVGGANADVLPVWAGAGHCGAGELDADGSGSGLGVVGMRVEPDQVADPVCVGVAGEEDVVVDLVVVKVFEGSVAIG